VLTKTTEKESAFKRKYSNPTNQGKMVGVLCRAQSAEQGNPKSSTTEITVN